LLKHNLILVFFQVLLYTDRSDEVLLGVVAALGTLMLGTETAVGPDDDLVVQFCRLLNSESDVIVMEAAKLLGRMIYQVLLNNSLFNCGLIVDGLDGEDDHLSATPHHFSVWVW
jgi:hypothetical protein